MEGPYQNPHMYRLSTANTSPKRPCYSVICFPSILYNGPRHAKTYLRAYAGSEGPDQPAHPRSLIWAFHCPLTWLNIIDYRMYQFRENVRIRLCACAGWIGICILHMFECPFSLGRPRCMFAIFPFRKMWQDFFFHLFLVFVLRKTLMSDNLVVMHELGLDLLTLSVVGKIFSRRHFDIFFSFFSCK